MASISVSLPGSPSKLLTVVAAPYRQASQSGVVHLAYSFGRPVVATRVGGLEASVEDGVTGALAAPRDAGSLAAALRRALRAPSGAFDEGIRRVIEQRTFARYAGLVLAAADERPLAKEGP